MFRRLVLLLLPATALAQPTEPNEPITPARPDFTETPQIVPVGSVQLEFGLTRFGRSTQARTRSELGETTVRLGVARWTELRFDVPTYVLSDARAARGWSDARIYAIVYLGTFGGIDVGVQPALTLPSGTIGIGDGLVEPEFYALLKRETGGGASVRTIFGTAYAHRDRQDASRSRFALDYLQPVGRRVKLFVEYAGFYSPRELPREYAHIGARIASGQTASFDIHAAVGLGPGAETGFIGAGYAVRF